MNRKDFRILAPFTNINEIEPLKKAGADELYCGYVNEELTKRWPLAFNVLNRRREGQSFENYEDFREAVKKARVYNLDVYVTLNGLYTPEQYHLLLGLVKRIEALEGVKGIIVADVGFLLFLKKNKFRKDIHIGTGGTCFNSHTAYFFQNLGAQRIILDRQMTSCEIKKLITEIKLKIDIEIFIIQEGCGGFIDGYCTFFHCFEQVKIKKLAENVFLYPTYNTEQTFRGCTFFFEENLKKGNFEVFGARSHKKINKSFKKHPNRYMGLGCRICDLFELKEFPIKSLKIIGRGVDTNINVDSVKLVSNLLTCLLRKDISREDYQKQCKSLLSKVILHRKCRKSDCYFSCP